MGRLCKAYATEIAETTEQRELMRRCLLFLLFLAFLLVSCSPRGLTKLEVYFSDISPLMKSHAERTEAVNKAGSELLIAQASGSNVELMGKLRNYSNKLIWAIGGIQSDLEKWKRILPPPEAQILHTTIIQGLLKEMEGLTLLSSYYSSVLRYGIGDASVLNRGNALLAEGWKAWQEAKYELSNLARKVRK